MTQDRFSKMNKIELMKEVKRLTFPINGGRGLPVRDIGGGYYGSENSEKVLRQFLRFLYANLKEDYIAKIKVLESFEGEGREK